MTSARAAANIDATTATVISTNPEMVTGMTPGILPSRKYLPAKRQHEPECRPSEQAYSGQGGAPSNNVSKQAIAP